MNLTRNARPIDVEPHLEITARSRSPLAPPFLVAVLFRLSVLGFSVLGFSVLGLSVLGFSGLGFSGCCVTPPLAEKYFDRSTSLGTVKMFQYAVETRQFTAAYYCADPNARDKHSETKFKLYLKLAKIEEWDGLSPLEFIPGAQRFPQMETESEAIVLLEYLETFSLPVVLVLYGDERKRHA